MTLQNLSKSALAVALAMATLLGVGFFGYQLGVAHGSAQVDKAVQLATEEVEGRYEGEAYRQEVIAQLLAIVRSPDVERQLPDEARAVVAEASEEIGAGNLQQAAQLLPGVLDSMERDCIREDFSVAVRPGTPVVTCHDFGTKALVGQIINAGKEVMVTVDGRSSNILFGTAYNGSAVQCDLLVERRDTIDDEDVVWVSFAC